MTKSQLQPGMLVVTREGNEYLVLPNKLFGINTPGISLGNYADGLVAGHSNAFDIMQVYTTKSGSVTTFSNPQLRTLIWQREEYEYPLYRKLGQGSYITIKFTGLRKGTVVDSNTAHYKIGYTATNWVPHTDDRWEPVDFKEDKPLTFTLEEICEALGITIQERY